MEQIRICRICGDKAYSCNFNGLPSCPSCRVFFYRNAQNLQKLKCRKENKCELDFLSRKCCPKCRLDKCFSIGMKLSKKNTDEKCSNNQKSNSLILENILETNIRDNICDTEFDAEFDKEFDSEFNILDDNSSKENLTPESDSNQIELSFELNTHELVLIEEIQNAMTVFEEESTLPISGEAQSIIYLSNLSTAYSRRIVRFCKAMPIFKSLNNDDQLLLLKPFCFEVAAIRGAFQYEPEKNQFTLLGDESGTHAVLIHQDPFCVTNIKCAQSGEQNYAIFKDLKVGMENDVTIRNLLHAILLVRHFSKEQNSLENVRYQYFVYCHLLRRYFEQKYQDFELADEKFSKLLNTIQNDLPVMKENMKEILIEYGVDQVADFIVEILNLKD